MAEQPNPFAPHWLIRDIVIGSHLSAVGPGGLLFLGDSIVEGFYWNRIANLPVLNAGYSGIWAEALEPKTPRLLQAAQPRLAVLLVGANDAKKDRTDSDLDASARHVEQILGHARNAGITMVVMTPPPLETGKRLTSFYSVEAMVSLSDRIGRIARRQGSALVDLHHALAGEGGAARPGTTVDGIHLSAQGYRVMHDLLERQVASMMA